MADDPGDGRKRGRASDGEPAAPPGKRSRRDAVGREWGGEKYGQQQRRLGSFAPAPAAAAAPLDDPRVALLPRAAFPAGGRVLDVGCSAGTTALLVAERFPALQSVVGVDVDGDMVRRARAALAARRLLPPAPAGGVPSAAGAVSAAPLSVRLTDAAAAATAAAAVTASSAPRPASALDRVLFRREDILDDSVELHDARGYDAVLCLRVTKWVHLNHGDRGIFRLFRRLHALLAPGGRLVLQAQPLASYKRSARGMPPDVLSRIALAPADFPEYLLLRVGFSALEATIDLPATSAALQPRAGGGAAVAAAPLSPPPQLLVFRKAA